MTAISRVDINRYQDTLAAALRLQSRLMESACRAFNRNKREDVGAKQASPVLNQSSHEAEPEGTIFHWIAEGLESGLNENELAELLRLRSVLAFIKGVQEPIGNLTECVNRKIDGRLLFTDAAVREANDLFRKVQFLANACADAVQTGSPILKSHVTCGSAFVSRLLDGYAVQHQQRRAGGQCKPRGAAVYEEMLAQFGVVLAHLKEIASHIPGEVELETWACPVPHMQVEHGQEGQH